MTQLFSDVDLTISPNDQMAGNMDEYILAGQKALQICRNALGTTVPRRIVDFPSGHGRVMRWFKREWAEAELHAVEIDDDALCFVERQFGARAIRSSPSMDMEFPQDVDLIFSGSLLTHFDVWQWDAFFTRCLDALSPGGVLVFTVHGRIAALLAEKKHEVYGRIIDTHPMHEEFVNSGFSYRNYSDAHPIYGLSLSSPSWVIGMLDRFPLARIVLLEEGGWGHQDVYAVRRNEWPMIVSEQGNAKRA